MKRVTMLVFTLIVAATAATAYAQLTEKIDVRVVNVDVAVTSQGKPVNGLTREDFEIREDGRAQRITNFYVSDDTSRVAASAAAAPEPVADERFRRRVLVLVDNAHTTRHSRDAALRELEGMINDRFHGEYEWSIGVIGRGVVLVLPLTSDKKAIHAALETIRRAGTRESTTSFAGAVERQGSMLPPTESKQVEWSKMEDASRRLAYAGTSDDRERTIAGRFTVPAIVDAARGFASTPGRKIVFLLTGDPGLNDIAMVLQQGEGFPIRGVSMGKAHGENEIWSSQRTIEDFRKAIVHEANSSDVSFYIWNVEGLDAEREGRTDTSAIFWLAQQTGGRLVTGNNLPHAVQEFDTVAASFYSLGYTPSHPDDGKYHAISVRVKRPGNYSLAYRTGYGNSSPAAQFARSMTSPTAAAVQPNGLPVTLELGIPHAAANEVTVPIAVKVPLAALQFLPSKAGVAARVVVYVSVFNEAGRNLVAVNFPLSPAFKSGTPDEHGTLVYKHAVTLHKGEEQRVVVAVRDTVTDSSGVAMQVVKF